MYSQLGIMNFASYRWEPRQVTSVKNMHLSNYLKGLKLSFIADPAEDKISVWQAYCGHYVAYYRNSDRP